MIATTVAQSRKLLEIGIDPETADMHYAFSVIGGSAFQDMIDNSATLLPGKQNTIYHYEPAWSLSALIDIIPESVIEPYYALYLQKEDGKYSIGYGNDELLCVAYNPVDACVEMIIKLHEQKLL